MSNTEENFLVVTSNDRNVVANPKTGQYYIDLNNVFKRIKQIQLIHAILPKQGTILNQPYLLLTVNELSNSLYANDQHISSCFQLLPILTPVTGGDYIHLDTRKNQESIVYFIPSPKESLKRITINIKDYQGNIFDFGEPNGDVTKTFQNTFIFKITTEKMEF